MEIGISDFFHLWASNRTRKNTILELRHERLVVIDIQQLHNYFHDHFTSLIGNSKKPLIKANWQSLCLEGPLQLEELNASFTEDEIKVRSLSLHPRNHQD